MPATTITLQKLASKRMLEEAVTELYAVIADPKDLGMRLVSVAVKITSAIEILKESNTFQTRNGKALTEAHKILLKESLMKAREKRKRAKLNDGD